ncbi:hypothetical protein QJS10_CPA02g01371 [Acorus calamus]|uniref:Autophagy-related protein 11 n=1 Tax=Acorus calamus TaxID=4465 RepID=A0AAV9FBF8_ACOCL|nr:hypothetical protein QJS10_CPA02g01371 [Acorus calamus]
MSSVVTDDDFASPSTKKLVVYIAENGRSLEFDCDGSTPVEAVQRSIESAAEIPINDQLLLCLDTKLEPQRPLSFYKLPSLDGRDVFLYNRARLVMDSPPPPPERVDIPALSEPPPPPASSRNTHPLDNTSDPALKALPSYEREFRYHFQQGHAVYVHTQVKFQACERLLRELRVQERALETARGSMEHFYRIIHNMYSDFMKCYLQQHRHHSDLLVSFQRDLERLRLCRLHPSLQSGTRKCLLDFVKEESLRKWAENCSTSHRQFEAKVSQLKAMFGELKRRVDDLFSNKVLVGVRELEASVKEHVRYINEQKSIMQSLSKDVGTVKKLVDDCVSSPLSPLLRPHDAVSALGPMYDVHDKNHLPRIRACDRSILKLLEICKAKKNEMNIFVHSYMQKVAYIQSFVKDIRLQFPAFKEAMGHQDDIFTDLNLVRGVGPAYKACLAEVVRRKASMKLYMGLAGQLAEKLAAKREAEVQRREEFLKSQSAYIPRDVLASMGLFDMPSQCDVNIVPFDTNLLEIDIVDVDRYSPDYLAGLPHKGEKHAMPKSPLSMSSGSCNLTEVEESSQDAPENSGSEVLLEVESVEIAGTSKLEVENAWLKAELASAIVMMCSLRPDIESDSLDDSKVDNVLKNIAEKTAEALNLKDEYGKHLQSLFKTNQLQCLSYKKRIQELEQRLADQYAHGQKISVGKNTSESSVLALKTDECKSEISGDGEVQMPHASMESMDAASFTLASVDLKLEERRKTQENFDENMTDLSGGLNLPRVDSAHNLMDASMIETHRDEQQVSEKDGEEKISMQLGLISTKIHDVENSLDPQNMQHFETSPDPCSASKTMEDIILDLQNALAEKSRQYSESESRLVAAMEELTSLGRELEISRKLLDESQMNCAHLENCLHEAREEAHTNLCAADRRASEYSALRSSSVKMRGLFERFRSCVTSSTGVASFADSLRSLGLSLTSSVNDNEDDVTAEFGSCIKVLADKVSFLSRHRAELLERCSRSEAAQAHLMKELEEKKEMVKNLYTKHQLEKQANKEKISFGRLEVHELAAFVLNSSGHYEAINRNCLNYYLSSESIALFVEHLPSRPPYIIGQVVHIERQIVRSPIVSTRTEHGDQLDNNNRLASGMVAPPSNNNPYSLPVGCEYFIITVAMLPDTIHSPLLPDHACG